MNSSTSPSGARMFMWTGPMQPGQPDTNPPFLMVTFTSVSDQEPKESLGKKLASSRGQMMAKHGQRQQTPAEYGQINGLACLRTYRSGVSPQGGFMVRGFDYAVQDGPTVATLFGEGRQEITEAVKLAEAAVLTFRKK